MYFSKVSLKPNIEVVRQLNQFIYHNNDYATHQLLWKLFPDVVDSGGCPFIYRDETNQSWPNFYLVSKIKPIDLHHYWNISIKDYKPNINLGGEFEFLLRVNPRVAKKVMRDGKVKSVHYDVIQDFAKNSGKKITHELIQKVGESWLFKRMGKFGFDVKKVWVDNFQKRILYKSKQSNPIRFSTIDYRGHLQVSDVEKFKIALIQGIGPAKSFGCGLLLIKK